MPRPSRMPSFSEADEVSISVVHLPKDSYDSKFSPRFLGPFKISAVPYPYVYELSLGSKFPNVHPRFNAEVLRPFVQPSSCAFRKHQADHPVIGDASRPIESLVARAPARGRPPASGRRSYQYKCRFEDLDAHYDIWLTEKQLHNRHPERAPSLIASCDARYHLPRPLASGSQNARGRG